jgi:hypothetical protein
VPELPRDGDLRFLESMGIRTPDDDARRQLGPEIPPTEQFDVFETPLPEEPPAPGQ